VTEWKNEKDREDLLEMAKAWNQLALSGAKSTIRAAMTSLAELSSRNFSAAHTSSAQAGRG
jgi:hypothetical protein